MITENLSTLKIHKLTQTQYDRELAAGRIDESALYLTPDEEIDLSGFATKEELAETISSHTHEISNILSGALPIELGGTGATTIEEVLVNLGISELLSNTGEVKMATGSYTGNGNTTELVFEFEPKLVFIGNDYNYYSDNNGDGTADYQYYGGVHATLIYGLSQLHTTYLSGNIQLSGSYTGSSNKGVDTFMGCIVWNANTVKITGASSSPYRTLCSSGNTYNYVAIG